MNASDKQKDFIDKFFDIFEPYQKSGVRFWAIIAGFLLLFVTGLIIAPSLIQFFMKNLSIKITLIQLSPYETIFNYLKIAFFFATCIIAPFALYQFGKLKVEKLDFESRMDLLIGGASLFVIIILSFFLTYKFFLPFMVFFLYGSSSNVAEFTSSISSMVSSFMTLLIITILLILLPFMRYIIKKSLFFNYATLIKFRKPIMVYSALLAIFLILPCEFIILGLLFLFFFSWYKGSLSSNIPPEIS